MAAVADSDSSGAWESYLVPGHPDALRNLAEVTDPVAIAIVELITAGEAEQQLRTSPGLGRTFDLAHLNAIHRQRFADVYPFAGQPRHVDLAKPGQTGEPFVHHAWIGTYVAAVAGQLSAEDSLRGLDDPSRWADRAGYYWAAPTHAHPYGEGNGRTVRVWLLSWLRKPATTWTGGAHRWSATPTSPGPPLRGTSSHAGAAHLGRRRHPRVDRPRGVLDDLDDLDRALRAEAWAHTGLGLVP